MKTYKEFYQAIKNLVTQAGRSNFISRDVIEQLIDEFELNKESYSTK